MKQIFATWQTSGSDTRPCLRQFSARAGDTQRRVLYSCWRFIMSLGMILLIVLIIALLGGFSGIGGGGFYGTGYYGGRRTWIGSPRRPCLSGAWKTLIRFKLWFC